MLSLEMTHGMTKVGVPHFTHATINSVCDGVDVVAHTNSKSRSAHCCCCMMAAYFETEDWIDRLENETLFGCLFEAGEIPMSLMVLTLVWHLQRMLVLTNHGVLARLNAQTIQTLTHFKLIIGVKVSVDHVSLFVSSIVDLANPSLSVVRQGCV